MAEGVTAVDAAPAASESGVTAEPATNPTTTQRRRSIAIVVKALLALVLVGAYYLAIGHSDYNSDQVSPILEGRSFVGGNVLLGNWWVPSDNFLFVNVPLAGIVQKIVGFGPAAIQLACAILFVAMLALLVKCATRGFSGAAAGVATLFVVAIIGLPSASITVDYFQRVGTRWLPTSVLSLEHVSTFALIAASWLLLYAGLDDTTGRIRRNRAGMASLAGALICSLIALFDDPMALFFFVAPIAVMCAFALLRRRQMRLHLTRAAAALGVLVVDQGMRRAIQHFGGFISVSEPTGISPIHAMPERAIQLFKYIFTSDGGAPQDEHGIVLQLISAARGIAIVVVLVSVAVVLVRYVLGRESDDTAVFFALGATIFAASIVGSTAQILGGPRYGWVILAPATVACARLLARTTLRAKYTRYLRAAAVVVVATGIAGFAPATYAADTAAHSADEQLVQWLEDHDVQDGIASYWTGDMVTLLSDGKLVVLPVGASPTPPVTRIYRQLLLTDGSWYSQQPTPANQRWFSITDYSDKLFYFSEQTLRLVYGAPLSSTTIGDYTIDIWSTDVIPQN